MLSKTHEPPVSPKSPYVGRTLHPNLSTCVIPKVSAENFEYPTTVGEENFMCVKSGQKKFVCQLFNLINEDAAKGLVFTTADAVSINPDLKKQFV